MGDTSFRAMAARLSQADERQVHETAHKMQRVLEEGVEKISDFDVKQGALHLWNAAVRLRQQREATQTNCESKQGG